MSQTGTEISLIQRLRERNTISDEIIENQDKLIKILQEELKGQKILTKIQEDLISVLKLQVQVYEIDKKFVDNLSRFFKVH